MPRAKWRLGGKSRFGAYRLTRRLQYCCCAAPLLPSFQRYGLRLILEWRNWQTHGTHDPGVGKR